MSHKRASLFETVAAAPHTSAAAELVPPVKPEHAPLTARKRGAETPGRPPSRQGKRVVSVYVEPEAAKQLGILAIREETSIQALMVEALNDFFAKRGVNRIA